MNLDNAEVARIAAPDLAPDALRLLREFEHDDDIVFFLGRLIGMGQMSECLPALLAIAKDPTRERYARMASIRGVMAIGDDDAKIEVLEALASQHTAIDRRILAEAIEGATPDARSVEIVLRALENAEPEMRFSVTGLREALRRFIESLPLMTGRAACQPLARMAEGLNLLLQREPHKKEGNCGVSQEFAWLMPSAIQTVERLVAARADEALDAPVVSILLKFPLLRYWDSRHRIESSSTLAAAVPRWRDLNDRLFWHDVEDSRMRLAARNEPLTDSWQVGRHGRFWSFDKDDFERCAGWSQERHSPDERLIAFSLALQLFIEAHQPPEWLDRLHEIANASAALASKLDTVLHPKPSEAQAQFEAEQRQWDAEHKARMDEENRDRMKWVRDLQADPNRVRTPPGLKPGDFSNDQYFLLLSVSGDDSILDHARQADWRRLETEFGPAVAEAFRGAAIDHWRAYTPELISEGATLGSTPAALVFGLVGLAIEAGETPDFPRALNRSEAAHALRYLTWELNGFPQWFEPLYQAFPDLGLAAVKTELIWELEHSDAEMRHSFVLHDIVYHAPWLHQDVAPLIFEWLSSHEMHNSETLRYCTTIMVSGGLNPRELAGLAEKRARNAAASTEAARWFSLWVDADPAAGVPALESWLNGLEDREAVEFAQHFIVSLLGDRHGAGSWIGAYRTADHLKSLYVLMHRFIRVQDDIDRLGKGAYSPSLRDNAQDGRNQLFALLSELPGPDAYAAIKALGDEHPDTSYRSWMVYRARQRAIQDADEPLWAPDQIYTFMSEL